MLPHRLNLAQSRPLRVTGGLSPVVLGLAGLAALLVLLALAGFVAMLVGAAPEPLPQTMLIPLR